MRRICKNNRFLVVPMDHGVTIGPVKGIIDIDKIIRSVSRGGATAVLGHKGFLRAVNPDILNQSTGTILHLSASTSISSDPNNKVLVGSLEDGLRLGVDGISVHINVGGSDDESEMLADLGEVATECHAFNVPLLA